MDNEYLWNTAINYYLFRFWKLKTTKAKIWGFSSDSRVFRWGWMYDYKYAKLSKQLKDVSGKSQCALLCAASSSTAGYRP